MHLLRILFILFISSSLFAQNKVFVLDIKGDIDYSMTRHVNNALESATKEKADYILVDMNTYGGLLDESDKIKTLLLNYPKPVWVFINDNAASAGALLSLACDSIYMAPGASIGAATVVTKEDGMALPDKYQSYMRSKMKAVAEANHRDTSLAEAMVDPLVHLDSSIKLDGQVLTLTTKEAIRHGICDLQVTTYEDIFKHNHIVKPSILRYNSSASDGFFGFLMNNFVTAIIIFIILIGIFIELGSPSGIPTAIVITLGILFFIPRYNAGLIQTWEIILLGVGLVLLLMEVFVIPGFGVVGIAGIVAVLGSLGMMMINNDYFNFDLVPSSTLNSIALILFCSILLMVILFFIISSKLLDNKYFRKLVLTESLSSAEQLTPNTLHKGMFSDFVDKSGIAHTDLRPSGKVEIEGEVFDAYTKGDFISKGKAIKIISVFNNSLIVKEIS